MQDPERLLDDLELQEVMGSGAGGTVFRGLYHRAYVAVKMLCAQPQDDVAGLHEARLARRLRHPHVVATYCARGARLTAEFLDGLHASAAAEQQQPGRGGHPSRPREGRRQEPPRRCLTPPQGGSGGQSVRRALAAPPPAVAHAASCSPLARSGRRSDTSEDGLGDPRGPGSCGLRGWSDALASLQAQPGMRLWVLVQEACALGNLAQFLQRNGFRTLVPSAGGGGAAAAGGLEAGAAAERLRRRLLLRTAAEVAGGMRHLHSQNVVHGDLKPANVLLALSGTDQRGFLAKVCDFGLARMLPRGESYTRAQSFGTIAYAAPELLTYRQLSKGSDVYSFGVLLHEMMTCRRPFEGCTWEEVFDGVAWGGLQPPWPTQQWPELCAVAQRCCARDRAQRPSFAALEAALSAMSERMREGAQPAPVAPQGAGGGPFISFDGAPHGDNTVTASAPLARPVVSGARALVVPVHVEVAARALMRPALLDPPMVRSPPQPGAPSTPPQDEEGACPSMLSSTWQQGSSCPPLRHPRLVDRSGEEEAGEEK
ncbi:hypothetical protein HYH03_005625 [Edaphochlamys debaryana]|uniref:Protein kinase domain-containing protein n=1 Tax=Edaphochlamys debaryana TaxID=47281 RepID=A0A835Y5J7_9CHLO|nr:hypothetical protein HYH03_005625 [Edaphochlamys debaryana]|eukprot:KAG2496398.1 hypothetical protein HYH03_005625 [Edaphochlamys debaryana]